MSKQEKLADLMDISDDTIKKHFIAIIKDLNHLGYRAPQVALLAKTLQRFADHGLCGQIAAQDDIDMFNDIATKRADSIFNKLKLEITHGIVVP